MYNDLSVTLRYVFFLLFMSGSAYLISSGIGICICAAGRMVRKAIINLFLFVFRKEIGEGMVGDLEDMATGILNVCLGIAVLVYWAVEVDPIIRSFRF